MEEKIKPGQYVKVPFMINARGDIKKVSGKIERIHGNYAAVALTGKNKGYSVDIAKSKLHPKPRKRKGRTQRRR